MDVLVQLPLSEEQRARLEAAAPGARFEYVKPRTVTREQVEAADAIVGNVPTEMLAGASGLRLLQLNSAGYEQYAAPGVLPDGCALCCATGAYGQAVSEHLFAMVLSLVKRLPAYQDRQRAHDWCDLGPVTTLRGARVLVLGAGDIGTHLQMGIGDGVIPKILNKEIYDHIYIVSDEEAIDTAKKLASMVGLMCGISSGTNVAAALQLAKKLGKGKTVVTVLPDTAERYFSTPLFDE